MHTLEFIPNEEEREDLQIKEWNNEEMIDDMFINHKPTYYTLDDLCFLFVYTVYYTKEHDEIIRHKITIQMLGDYPYSKFISYNMDMINHHIDEPIPPHALFHEFLLWFKSKGMAKIKKDMEKSKNMGTKAFRNISKYVVRK